VAVSNQTPSKTHTANGATTTFAYDFLILDETDLQVLKDQVSATLNVDYTVTGVGNNAGGTVVFAVAPAAATEIVLRRNMQFVRANDYQQVGDFMAATVNKDFDRPVMMLQQLAEEISRAPKVARGSALTGLEIPTPEGDGFWRWNAAANAIEWVQLDLESAGAAALKTDLANGVDAAKGSALVGYLPAGTGAVGRTVQDKLRESVSFKDFGATGDGVTDDTAEVLSALNSGARVVDGQGLTYKLTSNIAPTSQNIVIQNAKFDISTITTGGSAIGFTGAQGAGVALTANTLTGSNAIVVGNTATFAADTYAWLASSTVFDTMTGTVLGQVVKIKSVDSATALTLYEDVLYDFTTAATATIAPLTLKQNITFRSVRFVGANTGTQTAVSFDKCADVTVDGCEFSYVDYVCVGFSRCVNSQAHGSAFRYARAVGLAYGVAISNGSYSIRVANCYGEDTRHFVTVGDNDGVNLFITVTGCHAASSKDAGIDAHPACDFMVIDGNTIELVEGQYDGIIFQGLNCVITNNAIVGNTQNGIRHQLLPAIGAGSCVISGNSIGRHGGTAGTDTAIYVNQSSATATLDGVVIANNTINGTIDQGIYVYADAGNIKNVAISGNVLGAIASAAACLLRADAGLTLEDFTIAGNVFKSSGTQNVYLLGTTAPNILNGVISGNTLNGGINGIRMIQTQNVVETGNYNTGSTRKVFIDTGSSNITLDRRQSSVVTMTNATYTVLDQDEYLIANRAGTITATLPAAASHPGRELKVKTIQAQAVDSASANVAPIGDSAAGTAILPATDGAWALLVSNGTNWIVMQRGT